MQHAARYHIASFENRNPGYARKMSERLEEILKAFKDDWDAQEQALRDYIETLKAGDVDDFPGLSPESETPFVRLVLDITQRQAVFNAPRREKMIALTLDLLGHIRQEIRRVGFWQSEAQRDGLIRHLVRSLMLEGGLDSALSKELAYQLVALAHHNREILTR